MSTAPSAANSGQSASAELKSREILERIKTVFASKGFDGASMQDLARAASMSAGNFYRYFPSKQAIIAGLIERDLADIDSDLQRILASPDPRAAFRAALEQHLTHFDPNKGPLWAEIEAASIRDASIGDISLRMQIGVMQILTRAFALIARLPEAEAERRFAAHAQMIMLLVKGTSSQKSCFAARSRLHQDAGRRPEDDLIEAQLHVLKMRVIDQILSDIAGDTASPVNPAPLEPQDHPKTAPQIPSSE